MNVLNFSFDSNSDSNSVSDEQEADQIFNNDIETKYIRNGNSDIIFNGKVKLCQITGGRHTVKIANHIENLEMKAGEREVHIKAPVDNITIYGGKSIIYVHDVKDAKAYKIYIKGGEHKIEILSYVHKLEIYGGNTTIKCNYINSKIDTIITIGGTRNIYLNPTTNKCVKNVKGGICDFHTTEPREPPISLIYKDGEGSISPTIYTQKKKDEICSICVDNFEKQKEVYILPCMHIFHKECLLAWFKGKTHKLCPNCKFEVKNKITK